MIYRKDVRAHWYDCDVCGKSERVHFYHDVHDHLPAGWVHLGQHSLKQEDDDLFLCPAHAKDEGLVRLMLRLTTTEDPPSVTTTEGTQVLDKAVRGPKEPKPKPR